MEEGSDSALQIFYVNVHLILFSYFYCIGYVIALMFICKQKVHSAANCIFGLQYKTCRNDFTLCITTFCTFSAHFYNAAIILIIVIILVTIIILNLHAIPSPLVSMTNCVVLKLCLGNRSPYVYGLACLEEEEEKFDQSGFIHPPPTPPPKHKKIKLRPWMTDKCMMSFQKKVYWICKLTFILSFSFSLLTLAGWFLKWGPFSELLCKGKSAGGSSWDCELN